MFINIKKIISSFILLSIFLIAFVLFNYLEPLNDKRLKLIKLERIQKICMKGYIKKRKKYIPQHSIFFAQKEIDAILEKRPIRFLLNSALFDENSSYKVEQTLLEISAVVNHVKDDVVLSIETHTDKIGSNQHNLKLSQKRADLLKDYFLKKTRLALIVAIGYGEELPLIDVNNTKDDRRIEINLKKINL